MYNFSVPAEQIPQPDTANAAQIVVHLLRASLESLDTNREAASNLISKACSVLEKANGRTPETVRGGLVTWQVKKVRAYVEANIDRPITIADLSSLVGFGPSYFQRAFKKSFGISPHVFILECRIKRAQTLMLTSDEPLCAIALAAGFTDQSHLSLRFHRAVGMTPSLWRRERQGDHFKRAS